MGNNNTKNTKNTISFPKPPKQLSRIEYIQQIKDSILWDRVGISSNGDQISGNPNHTCPYCKKPHVYMKIIIYSMFPSQDSVLQHFDNCPEVEKLWNKTKIEQEEAMKQWEERVKRLTDLQVKLKENSE